MAQRSLFDAATEAVEYHQTVAKANLENFQEEVNSGDRRIESLLVWKAEDAVISEEVMRQTDGWMEFVKECIEEVDNAYSAAYKVREVAQMHLETVEERLLNGTRWKHNSTSAFTNAIELAKSLGDEKMRVVWKSVIRSVEVWMKKAEEDMDN